MNYRALNWYAEQDEALVRELQAIKAAHVPAEPPTAEGLFDALARPTAAEAVGAMKAAAEASAGVAMREVAVGAALDAMIQDKHARIENIISAGARLKEGR